MRLAQGVHIYAPPSDKGFAGATYGPLYYLVGSRLINPGNPSYLPLRIFSALAIIGIAICCSLLTFWVTRSRMAAALSPLFFMSYGVVTYHGISALSDSVALFFVFSGFLVAYRFRDSRVMLLSAPLMCLGFYYKPQYIAGSLAVMIFLFLEKRYARLVEFLGTLAFFGFGLLAVVQWGAFPGQGLWQHFFLYHATVLSWYQFKIGLLVYILMFGAPVLLVFEYLRTEPDRLLKCYMACAVVLGLFTIARATAFIQYFFDTIFLVSVLVPALLTKKIKKGYFPADVLFLLALALFAGQWYTPPAPGPDAVRQFDAFQSYFRTKFPPHARAMGLRTGDLVQAGLDTPFSDLLQTRILDQRGVLSDEDLIKQIRAGWFSVIVLDFNLQQERDPTQLNYYLTAAARSAIEHAYRPVDSLEVPEPEKLWPQDRFYIYVPRSSNLQKNVSRRSQSIILISDGSQAVKYPAILSDDYIKRVFGPPRGPRAVKNSERRLDPTWWIYPQDPTMAQSVTRNQSSNSNYVHKR